MNLRNIVEGDYDALKKIHQDAGLPPACLPDFNNPLFFIKQAAEIDGKIAVAALIRLTAEAYLLVDHQVATPEERWTALKALNNTVSTEAHRTGLIDMSCWVPPELARGSFANRLTDLGFMRSPWPCYSKDLTKED